jgi:hypothetical protein
MWTGSGSDDVSDRQEIYALVSPLSIKYLESHQTRIGPLSHGCSAQM